MAWIIPPDRTCGCEEIRSGHTVVVRYCPRHWRLLRRSLVERAVHDAE